MLNNLEKTPLRPYWYLSVLFIALGVYGSLSGVLPLTWIWFIVGGALAIVTQFNFETLKVSMGKMEKGSWKIIFWSIILTFITSFATMALGNLLFHTGFVENSNAVHTGPILAPYTTLSSSFHLFDRRRIDHSFSCISAISFTC